ncbi:hypothetical protein I5Q34_03695 [Streptomyces sp. AV19]|uniref:hypothetical protein n=1 Tax=Streptomyces sp. AV19 TaxID=2793068 RepID=UPI0018FEE240|nr:hypothetical protein [Streptomyces sp. AV19]MBH1933397.1 hypothetical protein [Streptomyces sp. AV19]MDG4536149.1 hypothetical protein [Streptomyces sp. AV19]
MDVFPTPLFHRFRRGCAPSRPRGARAPARNRAPRGERGLRPCAPGLRSRAETVAHRFPGAELRQSAAEGIGVTLGREYAAGPPPTASPPSPPAPTAVPSRVAEKARSADDDVCSGLSCG